MAETRITDIIVPSVFTKYAVEPSIYRSRFFNSGAIIQNPTLSALLQGGGKLINVPFWKDTAGATGDVPSETVAVTVNNLTSAEQVARRQLRNTAWGSNDLSSVLSGDNPVAVIQEKSLNFWSQAYDKLCMYTIRGVFADNIANDSGDLVNDISGGSGSAAIFSSDAVIDATAKLGENGASGANDNSGGNFDSIVVHSKVEALLRKQDLIDYTSVSGQDRKIKTYMGYNLVTDDNCYNNAGIYDSYVVKAGALEFGQSSVGYESTEIWRDPTTGLGVDSLYTRRCFAIHPVGWKWTETTLATAISPSDANLYAAANWDRVFNAQNAKMVMVRAKIA